ncbi:MAG: MFS transporter [Oscillospiraceae bacterium]
MKEKIVTKNFVCTFIAQLSLALVMYTLMSTITEYVAAFGTTATIAGLVSGIYVVGGLFSRMYSGNAMEKYGWKKIAVIFAIIHFAASCLYMFADNVVLLLIIRFIHGIGFGATMNAVMIIAMSGLPKSRYGEAAGYFMMSTSLGVAIGPFLGGLIYDKFGGNGCFIAAMVFSLIIVVSVSMADTKNLDPWYQKSKNIGRQKQDANGVKGFHIDSIIEKKAIPISLCIFCLCFGYAALMSFYRLYAQYTGLTNEFKYFFLIYAAMLIVSRPLAGKLQDKLGDNAVCYPCIMAQVVGIALLAWKPCMITIVICALCGALGYGTLNSTLNVIVNRQSTDERRPFAISTYWAFSDLGVGIAPAILGAIATASDYHVLYFTAALISLAALPIYWFCWGRLRKKQAVSD